MQRVRSEEVDARLQRGEALLEVVGIGRRRHGRSLARGRVRMPGRPATASWTISPARSGTARPEAARPHVPWVSGTWAAWSVSTNGWNWSAGSGLLMR